MVGLSGFSLAPPLALLSAKESCQKTISTILAPRSNVVDLVIGWHSFELQIPHFPAILKLALVAISHRFMPLTKIIKRGIEKAISAIRCAYFNWLIDDGGGKFVLPNPWMSVSISKAHGARLIVRGNVLLRPWLGGETRTLVLLSEGASLEFAGDFEIGHGVRIAVGRQASLCFGGRCKESASGITCDSAILVHHSIEIGADFICAWGVLISDCDWHDFNNQPSQADVTIGDRVWVAHNSSVLKGALIPDGCVIAAHSLVLGGDFSANSLIAGSPAKTKRTNIYWHRDMAEPL